MIFEFRDGYHHPSGVKAQDAGESLHRIRRSFGSLTPPVVVKEARKKDHPLHPFFEWNNRRAAHEHRLLQARQLISSIVRVERDDEKKKATEPVRAFIHINNAYEPVEVVMSDSKLRDQVLSEVYDSIEGLKRKVASYEQFMDVLKALARVQRITSKHYKGYHMKMPRPPKVSPRQTVKVRIHG
jgi:hypothetical protein